MQHELLVPQLLRKINSAGWGEELNESTVLENARVFVSLLIVAKNF